jgi:iron(III) transport system substrate-binding protein
MKSNQSHLGAVLGFSAPKGLNVNSRRCNLRLAQVELSGPVRAELISQRLTVGLHPRLFKLRRFALGIGSRVARFAALRLFICLLMLSSALLGCKESTSRTVIIYTSQDEEYAEPIFKEFEKQSGITVKAVFDSEAVKTVGLVNRLLAENAHPQCDVFWNNEEMRTRLLASRNIFRETNGWALLGWRSRRMVVNTNLLALDKAPHAFSEATNAMWRGKVALAYPLFGTTATHFLALRQHWGDAQWQTWCRMLAANKPFLLDGNSVAARQTGSGEALIGFTDSDDAASEQHEGRPIAVRPLTDESLIVHNTVGVVRGAPHPEAAQQLFDYLRSPAVQQKLVDAKALESATPADPKTQPGLKVNWDELIRDLDAGTKQMEQIFLR